MKRIQTSFPGDKKPDSPPPGKGSDLAPSKKEAKIWQSRLDRSKKRLLPLTRLLRIKKFHFLKSLSNITRAGAGQLLQSLRLKTKIKLVLLILFAVVTLLGMLGGYYVQRTSTNSLLMMQENYQAIN